MQPDEIVALFEGMLTRDGSRFTLMKLEPSTFGTGSGFRFEFELVRRVSNLTLRGVGYGAVSKGELFSLLYVAPRLNFYPRHIAVFEKNQCQCRRPGVSDTDTESAGQKVSGRARTDCAGESY